MLARIGQTTGLAKQSWHHTQPWLIFKKRETILMKLLILRRNSMPQNPKIITIQIKQMELRIEVVPFLKKRLLNTNSIRFKVINIVFFPLIFGLFGNCKRMHQSNNSDFHEKLVAKYELVSADSAHFYQQSVSILNDIFSINIPNYLVY